MVRTLNKFTFWDAAIFLFIFSTSISAFKIVSVSAGSEIQKGRKHFATKRIGCTGRPGLLYSLKGSETDNGTEYTQKQLLKEETEAPFRLVRIYFYASFLAAASLSAFICLVKILAVTSGSRAGDLSDLYTNLGINLAGIPVLAFLWKRDLDGRKVILDRIQRGGRLAGLKVKTIVDSEPLVVKLSDLRRDRGIEKRVVIVAAQSELLKSSLKTSVTESKNLVQNDLLIVPLAIEIDPSARPDDYALSAPNIEALLGATSSDSIDSPRIPIKLEHVGIPVFLNQWNEVIKNEMGAAIKQQPDALQKGMITPLIPYLSQVDGLLPNLDDF